MKSTHRHRNCRSAIQAMGFHTTHTVVTSTSYDKCCVHVTAYVAVRWSLSTTYTAVVLGLLLRQCRISLEYGLPCEYCSLGAPHRFVVSICSDNQAMGAMASRITDNSADCSAASYVNITNKKTKFSYYRPFVRRIHQSLVVPPTKDH